MNKKSFVLFSFLCAVLFTGCSKGPADTVLAYTKAMGEGKYREAYRYFPERDIVLLQTEMKSALARTKSFADMLSPEDIEELAETEKVLDTSPEDFFVGFMEGTVLEDETPFFLPEILKEEIDGDTATVWYQDQDGDESQTELIKEGGKWLMRLIPPQR